jgi:hypothetical protein
MLQEFIRNNGELTHVGGPPEFVQREIGKMVVAGLGRAGKAVINGPTRNVPSSSPTNDEPLPLPSMNEFYDQQQKQLVTNPAPVLADAMGDYEERHVSRLMPTGNAGVDNEPLPLPQMKFR